MKYTFLKLYTLLTLLASINAHAWPDCKQNEAQFKAIVNEVIKTHVDQYIYDCAFKLEFSAFDPSMICPMSIDVALNAQFEDLNCSLKVGDSVSGYLVEKNDTVYIE